MSETDQLLAQAEAELAALQSQVAQQPEPSYGLKQGLYDVGVGSAKMFAGLGDLFATPAIAGLNLVGVPAKYGALTSALNEQIGLSQEGLQAVGLQPETPVQEYVQYALPIGRTNKLAQAAFGTAAYAGGQIGKETIGGPYGELIGALSAPAAILGGKALATKALSPITSSAKVALGNEEALRNLATREVERKIGQEGLAQIAALPEAQVLGTGGVPLTAAEIVQTPSLAKYQRSIALTEGGGDVLANATESRSQAITDALSGMGTTVQEGEFATALQQAAQKAKAAKVATEGNVLATLGLTEEGLGKTAVDVGEDLRTNITKRFDDVNAAEKQAWDVVEGIKQEPINLTNPLTAFKKELTGYGRLTQQMMSPKTKLVLQNVNKIIANKGVATINDLQDLRRAAGRILSETRDRTEANLMRTLRSNLENEAISYLDDVKASGSALGGPGVRGTDAQALQKLSDAIIATREMYKTFGEEFTGLVTKKKGQKFAIRANKLVDKFIAEPDYAGELATKFGADSVENVLVREQMLARLAKSKKPAEYLDKYKASFQRVFGEDLSKIESYVTSKGIEAPLERFANIKESRIPAMIFADEAQTKQFIKEFGGTELADVAKGRFISEYLSKPAKAADELAKREKIAQTLFGTDYPKVQRVIKDLEVSRVPAELESIGSKNQSITAQRGTALGEIMSGRGIISLMKKGGSAAGLLKGLPLVGGLVENPIAQAGLRREASVNRFVAEILANPTMLNIAASAPTKANIDKLSLLMKTLGATGGEIATEQNAMPESIAALPTGDVDTALLEAEQELQRLLELTNQSAANIPTGAKYAPKELVKAVMQVESGGNQAAVSPKGARGMMQLMPPTAKELGVNPNNPKENIEGGSRYLQQNISRFGDTKLGVAAYNMGPNALAKALDKSGADSWEQLLAADKRGKIDLPEETKNYVKKVMNLMER